MRSVELNPEILEACDRAGAFPMADGRGGVEFYRSDPRSVLELDALHVSKSLRRVLRKGVYGVWVDRDFEGVIRKCADRDETWIDEGMIRSFTRLHEVGMAHSIEAYKDNALAGGLYGVSLGGAFMGESMFSLMADASKVCLVHLVEQLKKRGFALLDCQIQNDHMSRMGAVEIPEPEYLRRLDYALRLPCTFV